MKFRRSEVILLVYFLYVSLLALMRPVSGGVRIRVLTVNAILILSYAMLARKRWETVRDWLPYPLILLAYKEIGWLALPHASTALEQSWIRWDRLLLNEWGMRRAIESLGPLLPNLLELSYLLVYAVPAYVVALFAAEHETTRLDAFYVVLLLGTLGTYALYPFFPSEPPRSVFPNQDLPSMLTALRKLNLYFVNGYGIHTSVFPSGHVAAAFSAAFGLWIVLPRQRKKAVGLMVLAALIGIATVYGRYHYAVDALAGLGMAMAAAIAGRWINGEARRDG